MKKWMLFVLAALVLVLCACGNAKTPEVTPTFTPAAPDFAGSGTAEDPYRIEDAAGLWNLAKLVNDRETNKTYGQAHYLLTADIDLGGMREWAPIGTDANPFGGVLDGGGHTVSGIRINREAVVSESAKGDVGFLGKIFRGTVRNLTISDSVFRITAENSGEVAAIAGDVLQGTVENCHATATVSVTGSYHAAGICANLNSDMPIRNCTSAAAVTVTGQVGSAAGIVVRSDGHIENCVNTGPIFSAGDAAGIASTANAGLADCRNDGAVTAADGYAAGIVCRFGDGALNHSQNDDTVALLRCVNNGPVRSDSDPAGGIAVRCSTGNVADCVNTGSVTSPMEAGGIFAYFNIGVFGAPCERFTVTGCTNSGAITNSQNADIYSVGGICGMIYGSDVEFFFENCANAGAISSGEAAGGILGSGTAPRILFAGCVNTGAVTGSGVSGGIVGDMSPHTGNRGLELSFRAENCRNEGTVYVKRDAMNFGGTIYLDSFAGGIAGKCWNLPTEDPFAEIILAECVNTGVLTGDDPDVRFFAHDLCASFLMPEE